MVKNRQKKIFLKNDFYVKFFKIQNTKIFGVKKKKKKIFFSTFLKNFT